LWAAPELAGGGADPFEADAAPHAVSAPAIVAAAAARAIGAATRRGLGLMRCRRISANQHVTIPARTAIASRADVSWPAE
jgi:hypothetical protein